MGDAMGVRDSFDGQLFSARRMYRPSRMNLDFDVKKTVTSLTRSTLEQLAVGPRCRRFTVRKGAMVDDTRSRARCARRGRSDRSRRSRARSPLGREEL